MPWLVSSTTWPSGRLGVGGCSKIWETLGRNKGPEVIFLSPALCLAVSQNYVPLNTFPIHPFLNPLWSRQTLLQVVVEFIAVSFLSWLLLSWHLWIHFLCMPQSESFDRKKGGHHLLLVHMNIDQKERSDKLTHKGKITLYDHKTQTKTSSTWQTWPNFDYCKIFFYRLTH